MRTLGIVFVLFLSFFSNLRAQSDSSYSFIAAGHAYGSHDGGNLGLHPALLDRLFSGFDTTAGFIVFTGDIVNHSTAESWKQVEDELDSINLPYYFVMGNHDDSEAGRDIFNEKFGGSYYAFYSHGDLYIVLNSIEADRAISEIQLTFLREQISQAPATTGNIFIFFHEVIWNSQKKYIGVRSNSRSRYDQVVEHSNYWEEVHPVLMEKTDKNFFLISGDVGGNPDAISAFYDRWDHVTFLSSGMGEVADENYLLIHINGEDSVSFELVALNSELTIPGIKFYSVPAAPEAISGPGFVFQGSKSIEYLVPEVFNASSYVWELPQGVTGSSMTHKIEVDFDISFELGELSVRASRDGFGTGAASSMLIQADFTSVESPKAAKPPLRIKFLEGSGIITIECEGLKEKTLFIQIMDGRGRIIKSRQYWGLDHYCEFQLSANDIPKGLHFISASTGSGHYTLKKILFL